MAYELAQAYVQILPTTKGMSGQLSDLMGKDAETAGTNAGSKFSGSFAGSLKTLGKAAAGALMAGTGAMVAFSATAVQAGMDFDSAMSQVAATMGMSMDEMLSQTGTVELAWGSFSGNLRDYAQEMGANTAFSASEAADALNYMALAGYDAQTSMEMLPNVLNLAAAGSMDLALASDMITDTQSALGLSLEETSTMVDQMARASSKSNTSVEQLGDAMLKIGATARNVKGGTQELSTVLGVLADNGIKGAEGGTHLRNIMLSLQDAVEDGSVVFGDYAVDVYDSEGNMRSLIDIMKEAKESLGDVSQEGRDAVLSGIFNKTDLAAVNALLGTTDERFDELAAAIGDSAGAAQDMADTQLDNLAGDVQLFKSALEGTQIALSDMLTPTLREFVQLGSEGLSQITESLRSGDISAAAESFGHLISDAVTKAVENLPQMIEAGGKLLRGLIQGVTENVDSIAGGIAQTAVSIAEFFAENTGPFISGALEIATEVVSALIKNLPQILVSLGEGIIDGVTAVLEAIPEIAMGIFESVVDIFGDWDGMSDEYLKETQKILGRSDEIEESWGKVQEAKDNVIGTANSEATYYSNLLTQLDGITTANGKVKEGYEERAKFIMGELAEATGVEADLIDGRIEGYEKYKESIENAIKAQRAEAILAAEKSAYEEALTSQTEIAAQMVEVQGQMEEAQLAYEDTLSSFSMKVRKIELETLGYTGEALQKQLELEAAQQSGLQDLQTEYGELESALSETYTVIGQYEEDFKKASEGNYDEIGQSVQNWSATSLEEFETYRQQLQETIAAQEKQVEAAEKAVKEGRAGEWTVEAAQNALDGSKEALANLELEWQTRTESIASNLPESFGDMETTISTAATDAVNMVASAFTDGQDTIGGNAEEAAKAATEPFEKATEGMTDSGEAIPKGLAGGIKNGSGAVKTEIDTIANDIPKSFNNILGIQSPSTVMQASGENVMAGLKKGLEAGRGSAEGVMTNTAGNMASSVEGFWSSFYSAGASLMAGLASGMSSRSWEVRRIAEQAVKDALSAAKAAGDIKSPSKKMAWIGDMLMNGLAKGIRDNTTPVDAITDTVNDVNNALGDGLEFGTHIDNSLDAVALSSLDRTAGLFAAADRTTGETSIYITNNIDGASDPEEFASRLVRQIKLEMRMA